MKNIARFSIPTFVLTSVLLLCSCGNAGDKKDMEHCDQIAASLDSAEKKLLEANDDTLMKKFLLFKEASEKIEKEYYAIKTEENFSDLCLYRECKKPLRNLVSNYKIYQREVDTSAAQLDRLRHDIKKGLLTKEETTQYLTIEEQNARAVLKKITKSVDDALLFEKRFDSLHPRIIRYIERAKPKK